MLVCTRPRAAGLGLTEGEAGTAAQRILGLAPASLIWRPASPSSQAPGHSNLLPADSATPRLLSQSRWGGRKGGFEIVREEGWRSCCFLFVPLSSILAASSTEQGPMVKEFTVAWVSPLSGA